MKTILSTAILSIWGALALQAQIPQIPILTSTLQNLNSRSVQSVGSNNKSSSAQGNEPGRDALYYYFSLGHLNEQQYELTGRSEQAAESIDNYKKALALQPGSPVIMERLAEIYAKSQRIRDAVAEAQEVLKIDPNNLAAHRLLARIYVRTLGDANVGELQKENLAKAVEQFNAILKLDPKDTSSAL